MLVSKECIVTGLANYLSTEVNKVIVNPNFKFVMSAAIAAIQVNPSLSDAFFENPMIKSALKETDGEYDIDYAEQILTRTIKDCGQITLTIPGVPILMPQAQELTFRALDVEKLFTHIRNEVVCV